jgi:acyl-CoA thioesterase-1
LVLGDSLSAAYGLERGKGWVDLLALRMTQRAPGWRLQNASISGETSSGGRSRVADLLSRHRPSVLLVELGANDGLRGLPIAAMRENLEAIVEAGRRSGARVVLVGMQLPPNFGGNYAQAFARAFQEVGAGRLAGRVPFLLAGVAEHDEWFQADRLHPVEQAQGRILENVWPALAPLLKPQQAPVPEPSAGARAP